MRPDSCKENTEFLVHIMYCNQITKACLPETLCQDMKEVMLTFC